MQNFLPIRYGRQLWLAAMLSIAMQGTALASSTTSSNTSTLATKAPVTTKHHASSHKASKTATTHRTGSTHKKGSKGTKTSKKRGQQAIDPTRTRQIQEALIREHYLQGEPTGTWDSSSQAAMQRYQSDHGWQSKTTPDSRALIKLGLGPSSDHLLNPESAMTMPTNASPAAASKGNTKPPAPENKVPNR